MMEFIEMYISIPYLLAVLFGTEAANTYLPWVKRLPNQIVTLVVAAILVAVFFFMESPEQLGVWQVKIMVSFLGSIGMYDFIIKPIKDKLRASKIK